MKGSQKVSLPTFMTLIWVTTRSTPRYCRLHYSVAWLDLALLCDVRINPKGLKKAVLYSRRFSSSVVAEK